MNQGRILPFAEFCIAGGAAATSSSIRPDNTKIFWHPVHNPRPQRREGRKLVRDAKKGDELNGKHTRDAHVVQRDQDGGDKAEIIQEPLKDLPPEQNSPKKVVRERQQPKHGLGKRMPFADDDDDEADDDGLERQVDDKESKSAEDKQQDEDDGIRIVDHPDMLDERKEGAETEAEKHDEDTLAIVENSILHIGDNDNSLDERVPMPTMPSDSPLVSINETNNNIANSERNEQGKGKKKEAALSNTTSIHVTTPTSATQKQARLHRDISDILTNHLKRTTTSADSISDVAESPTETSVPAAAAQQHPRKHRPLGRAPSNPTSLLIRNSTTASNDSTTSSHKPSHPSTSTSATHAHLIQPIDEIDALLHRHTDQQKSEDVFRPSQALSYEDPEALKLKQGVWRQLGMGLDGVVEGEDEGRVVGIGVVRDRVRDRGAAGGGAGGVGRNMRSRNGKKGKGG